MAHQAGPNDFNISNNKIYNSQKDAIYIFEDELYVGNYIGKINSNTIHSNGTGGAYDGIKLINTPNYFTVTAKNNIITNNTGYGIRNIQGNITSSYNDIWGNVYGSYNGTSAGTGDISTDPLFADPTAGDFHLNSQSGRWNGMNWINDSVTSPCIDAGDLADDYSNEPQPNGGRINIGAYGNTAEASKSTLAILPPDLPDDKSPQTKISVYPNPYIASKSGTNKIIFAGLTTGAEIRIYDISGKLIQESSVSIEGKAEWSVADISSGVYLYTIRSSEGIKKGKISVIR